MIKRLALLITLFASPLAAQDMTDAERVDFRAEVRAYLLENPEVIMEAIAILQEQERDAELRADVALARANAEALFDDPGSFVGGNPDGDITIVEFMDYRCGYCKRAFPEVAELLASDGNIRYIIKEFPILGDQSTLASQFAISTRLIAGDDAYKLVHDTLMSFRGDVTPEMLARLGDSLELETQAILNNMASPEVAAIIGRNHALAQIMSISGTPTFVVDDQMLRGYVPLDQMRQIVAAVRG